MKQGPAEIMAVAVLKELLKDKRIVFSSKAKKSELVDLFNAAHHTSGTAAAYDGSIPKFKQFFFVNKQLLQGISRHLAS